MSSCSEPEYLLELGGLEQTLFDAASGERFTVRVDQPIRIPCRSSVALLGPSGCGKTTLLTVLGLLRAPTLPAQLNCFTMRIPSPDGGWITHDLKQLWLKRQRSHIEVLRRKHLGFALQTGELLPSLTVRENIETPLQLNGVDKRTRTARVDELLTSFNLEHGAISPDFEEEGSASMNRRRLDIQRINRLSGGEYQRVALARAVAHKPSILFVDEPTSALNRELAFGSLRQIRYLQCGPESNGALVMITHDEELALAFSDLIIRMAPQKSRAVGEVVEIVQHQPHEPIAPLERPIAPAVTEEDCGRPELPWEKLETQH